MPAGSAGQGVWGLSIKHITPIEGSHKERLFMLVMQNGATVALRLVCPVLELHSM